MRDAFRWTLGCYFGVFQAQLAVISARSRSSLPVLTFPVDALDQTSLVARVKDTTKKLN